jgi:DNA-binding GntR family transcriptional regulator
MKYESIADQAGRYLTEKIIQGTFPPGCRIKESEIASELNISRPPLREAFKVLEANGLIERNPRRGVFVSVITERDVWEIYTLKASLYETSVKLALDKEDDGWIKQLGHVIAKMEKSVDEDPPNIEKYQNQHDEFHGIILDKAGNERIKKIAESIHNQVRRISVSRLKDRLKLQSSCRYHRRIYEEIKSGNKEQSVKLTYEHVMDALAQIEEYDP